MGDVGSAFLGFTLATLAVLSGFDALYVGARAVLLNETRSSARSELMPAPLRSCAMIDATMW